MLNEICDVAINSNVSYIVINFEDLLTNVNVNNVVPRGGLSSTFT